MKKVDTVDYIGLHLHWTRLHRKVRSPKVAVKHAVSVDRSFFSVLPAEDADAVGLHAERNPQRLFGQQGLDVLRPFHQAEFAGIQIVVQADVQGLRRVFEPIEIEMEHRTAVAGTVFVHDREGGRTDGIFPHAQLLAERRGERGLARAHRRIKGNQAVPFDRLQKVAGRPLQVFQTFYPNLMCHAANLRFAA